MGRQWLPIPGDVRKAVFPFHVSTEEVVNKELNTIQVQPAAQLAVPDPQSVGFNSLSNELLVSIAEFAGCNSPEPDYGEYTADPYRSGPKDVLNLALCSRHLFGVTEPVLYGYFRQTSHNMKNQLQLMCRILEWPELASYVRVIQCFAIVAWDWSLNNSKLLDVSCLNGEDWQRIGIAVKAASRSEDEATDWIKAIEQGSWDPVMALLLFLLPKLEELEFVKAQQERGVSNIDEITIQGCRASEQL